MNNVIIEELKKFGLLYDSLEEWQIQDICKGLNNCITKENNWVLAKDNPPTKRDADENGYIDCAFWNNSKMEYYRGDALWFTIANAESDMTMWIKSIPLPKYKK